MHDWQSLSHVRRDCKYHVEIVPKYRKKHCMEDSGTKLVMFFGIYVAKGVLNYWKGI